jgi:hypothetical protein
MAYFRGTKLTVLRLVRRPIVIAGVTGMLLTVLSCAITVTAPTFLGAAQAATKLALIPNPNVSGPIPWSLGMDKQPQTDNLFALPPFGYSEREYFVSGTASHQANSGSLGSISNPGSTAPAPYTIRMIVRQPIDPSRFNGTVVVEWNNVTAQMDEAPIWDWTYPTVLREGYAYVIVSVQQAGICCSPLSLMARDPIRYASLRQPGDDYAFSIFSQVLQSIRHPEGVDPLAGLQVKTLLAAGQSQSADELFDYVTSVNYTGLVNGFLLVGGGSATFRGAIPPAVPVMNVFDEWTAPSTPPNISTNYRLWEIAGASHVDYWIDRQEFDDPQGVLVPGAGQRDPQWRAQEEELAGNYGYAYEPRESSLVPGGNMFPNRYVMDNALVWLNRWVVDGASPPTVPMLEFGNVTTSTPAGAPPGYDPVGTETTDQYGNALGGYRLPVITVPIATYVPTTGVFFGETVPLSPTILHRLYPTHQDYVNEMQAATNAAVRAGLLLPWDAADLMTRAKASPIPELEVSSPVPPTG